MIRSGAKTAAARATFGKMAFAAAVFFLAAQSLALAHYHQADPTQRFNTQAELVADSSLCALCLFALHLPLNPPILPSVARPHIGARSADTALAPVAVAYPYSRPSTRAPPSA
jgi:hypothetical protein